VYFDIYKSRTAIGHKYWWVAKGNNGETLAHSEMLSSKQACKDAIRVVKDGAASATVYDETGELSGDVSARRIAV
jgi:uncharacterized protein YegP (UPF0339 family)